MHLEMYIHTCICIYTYMTSGSGSLKKMETRTYTNNGFFFTAHTRPHVHAHTHMHTHTGTHTCTHMPFLPPQPTFPHIHDFRNQGALTEYTLEQNSL